MNKKYDDVQMLIVVPDSTWTEQAIGYEMDVIPLSEDQGTALIMDLGDEHHVVEPTQFGQYRVPERFEEIKFKNASKENRAYLLLKKEIENEYS